MTIRSCFLLILLGVFLYPVESASSSLATGWGFTCAIRAGEVLCWGANQFRQLGDGSTANRFTPGRVRYVGPARRMMSADAVAVAAGVYHACALTSSGAVKCWGWNEYGQLGDGTTTDRGLAVLVAGLKSEAQAISTGENHSCALTKAGAVWCWGDNTYGQLGDGTTVSHLVPTQVSGLESGVKAVATGTWISCALTTSGAVFCWGDNEFGSVGDGIETQTPRALPTQVFGLTTGVTAIAANGFHACAITGQGAVMCWGNNTDGPLGDDSQTDRFAPVKVSGLDAPQIALGLGYSHTCSISSGGAAHCWGYNGFGQLGNGTHSGFDLTPTPVVGLSSNIVQMAGGYDHTCAVDKTGFVLCWGNNSGGALGNAVQGQQFVPAVVVGLGAPRKAN